MNQNPQYNKSRQGQRRAGRGKQESDQKTISLSQNTGTIPR